MNGRPGKYMYDSIDYLVRFKQGQQLKLSVYVLHKLLHIISNV